MNNLGTLHAAGSSSSASGQGLRRERRRHGFSRLYMMDGSMKGGRIACGKLEMGTDL